MYECPCKTIESLDLIKRTTFDKNQFMTCYLIFNFRPTFFSYFWKITADSVFHNVKKQVGQKWPFPVVKGLINKNRGRHRVTLFYERKMQLETKKFRAHLDE